MGRVLYEFFRMPLKAFVTRISFLASLCNHRVSSLFCPVSENRCIPKCSVHLGLKIVESVKLRRCTSIPVVVRFLTGTLLIFNSDSWIFNVCIVVSVFPLFCYFSMFILKLCFSLSSHFYANSFFLDILKTFWSVSSHFYAS